MEKHDQLESSLNGTSNEVLSSIVIALFVVILAGTGIIDAVFPAPAPRLLPGEQESLATMRRDASFGDGSAARLVEHELRLRSRVRQLLARPYSTLLYNSLGELSSSTMTGEGDWMFLRTRAIPPPVESERLIGLAASVLTAIERRVTGLGFKMAYAPIPRKAVLHKDHLPPGVEPREDIDRGLVRELERRSLSAANLLELFEDEGAWCAEDNEDLESAYYPCDSHWSQASRVLAAEELCRVAGVLTDPAERKTRVVVGKSVTPAESFDLIPYNDVILSDTQREAMKDQGLHLRRVVTKRGGKEQLPASLTVSKTQGRIAICGTSFSDNAELPRSLAHFSQRTVLNAAMSAAGFMRPLRILLSHPELLTENEAIFVEFPLHQIFFKTAPGEELLVPFNAGALFAENPPAQTMTILSADHIEVMPGFAGSGFVNVAGRELLEVCNLPAGILFHSADGVAALEIEASVRGGDAEVQLRVGDAILVTPWPQGKQRIVLPLISSKPDAGAVRLFVRGAKDTEFDFTSAKIVAEFEGSTASELAWSESFPEGDGWAITAQAASIPSAERFSALLFDLPPSSQATLKEMFITSLSPWTECLDLTMRDTSLRHLRPGTRVLWDDGAFAAGAFLSLTVQGEGPLPPKRLQVLVAGQ